MLLHPFKEVLCFPNLGSGAVAALYMLYDAFRFLCRCVILEASDEFADSGGWLLFDVDPYFFQYVGYCLASIGDVWY